MNIHDKSRYHEVHARSLADPEGFWAEAAREIDWIEPAKKIFDPSSGAYGRWFTGGCGQHLLQRARPPCRRRPRGASGADPRFPADQQRHQIHLCRAARRGEAACRHHAGFRRRQGRPRPPLYAAGAGSRDGDAGLRADRRRAQRGVRRFCGQRACEPHRRRQAKADFFGKLRHRARPHRALQAAARRSDHACRAQSLRPASSCSGRSRLAISSPAAITTGRTCARPRSRRRNRRLACRCSPPIRSTSSTPRAPQAFRKAWCATMAGIWSR